MVYLKNSPLFSISSLAMIGVLAFLIPYMGLSKYLMSQWRFGECEVMDCGAGERIFFILNIQRPS
jgi:hypothetical protein